MDLPDISREDLVHAGELVNTASKNLFVQKFLDLIGKRFQRKIDQKDKQIDAVDEVKQKTNKLIATAEAEVKADLIRFKGELDKGEMLAAFIKRSDHRLLSERVRKDYNLENVLSMVQDELEVEGKQNEQPPVEENKDVNEDWFTRWTSIVEDVSVEETQRIWAKILAGEIKKPGTFSVRTLEVLRNLSQYEAQSFAKLCEYVIALPSESTAFVLGDKGEIHKAVKLSFNELKALGEAGLLVPGAGTSLMGGMFMIKYFLSNEADKSAYYVYGKHIISIRKTDSKICNGQYDALLLSQVGYELASIIETKVNHTYLQDFKSIYVSSGVNFEMGLHNIIGKNQDGSIRFMPLGIRL